MLVLDVSIICLKRWKKPMNKKTTENEKITDWIIAISSIVMALCSIYGLYYKSGEFLDKYKDKLEAEYTQRISKLKEDILRGEEINKIETKKREGVLAFINNGTRFATTENLPILEAGSEHAEARAFRVDTFKPDPSIIIINSKLNEIVELEKKKRNLWE